MKFKKKLESIKEDIDVDLALKRALKRLPKSLRQDVLTMIYEADSSAENLSEGD